jgi:hypothetical protein
MRMSFNRNIMTSVDITNWKAAATGSRGAPETFTAGPPAAPEGAPTADEFLTRLVKYVPLEIIGFYLVVAGVLDSNVKTARAHAWSLGALLLISAIATAIYDRRILRVRRGQQIAISVVGLVVYVFATGGWFATTTWYQPFFASLAVPAFALVVLLWQLPALPTVET